MQKKGFHFFTDPTKYFTPYILCPSSRSCPFSSSTNILFTVCWDW
jgi:hypothetical protein